MVTVVFEELYDGQVVILNLMSKMHLSWEWLESLQFQVYAKHAHLEVKKPYLLRMWFLTTPDSIW